MPTHPPSFIIRNGANKAQTFPCWFMLLEHAEGRYFTLSGPFATLQLATSLPAPQGARGYRIAQLDSRGVFSIVRQWNGRTLVWELPDAYTTITSSTGSECSVGEDFYLGLRSNQNFGNQTTLLQAFRCTTGGTVVGSILTSAELDTSGLRFDGSETVAVALLQDSAERTYGVKVKRALLYSGTNYAGTAMEFKLSHNGTLNLATSGEGTQVQLPISPTATAYFSYWFNVDGGCTEPASWTLPVNGSPYELALSSGYSGADILLAINNSNTVENFYSIEGASPGYHYPATTVGAFEYYDFNLSTAQSGLVMREFVNGTDSTSETPTGWTHIKFTTTGGQSLIVQVNE